ncbi:hypothetical protein Hte_008840 [Hypoxylon texense]
MPSSTVQATPETQPSRFEWQKSPNEAWEREIDECEIFYKLSSRQGSGCYPVTGCASFTIDVPNVATTASKTDAEIDVKGAFQKAWMTLCHRHPTLRSRIEHDEKSGGWKRVYSTLKGKDEEQDWFSSTFKVVDADVTPLQWFNNDSTNFETSTLFLVRSKQSGSKEEAELPQTIFLRCPHDVTDGVGVLQLVDQLFSHAATAYEQGAKYVSPEWGNEHERLSPCLRVAAAIPESFSDDQTKHFEEIQTRNGTVYSHAGLLSLPPSSVAVASEQSKRQRFPLVLPKDTTERILRGCKTIAPGVSVTHVFMSALAQALSQLQPKKEESYPVRYVNHSMINLRPYCRDPFKNPEHAAAAYHTVSAQALGIDLVVPRTSANVENEGESNDFARIAAEVRDYYKRVRPASPTDDQIVLAPLMFKSLTAPSGSNPHAASDPPFCPVALSSIGNVSSMVNPKHGSFHITNIWAASEPIGAGVALFLGTWNGQIELSGVFDTRYHDATYIEKFLWRIVNCVCKGLGIGNRVTPGQATPVEAMENKKRKRDEKELHPGNDEDTSSQCPNKSPVRSALRERPALGNVQRQPNQKVEESSTAERRVEETKDV